MPGLLPTRRRERQRHFGQRYDGIYGGGVNCKVQNNFIGTDVTGTLAIGNGESRVHILSRLIVGRATPGVRNIVSGNVGHGMSEYSAIRVVE